MNKKWEILWQKAQSLWSEIYLRIDTRGRVAAPSVEGGHYSPLPYPVIHRILKFLNLNEKDVFVDVGCGKGRVVCCASRMPVQKVVALELNSALLDQTLENVRRLRGRHSVVEPFLGTAEDYDYAEATVVYLYNPFNARLVDLVLDNLNQSCTKSPRLLRIVYANPACEEVLMKCNWLEKYAEWPASDFPGFDRPVSFWRTVRL